MKKYVVELTEDEREQLHRLILAGSASARTLNRAPMLETSRATVQRVRERFCRQGLEAAL